MSSTFTLPQRSWRSGLIFCRVFFTRSGTLSVLASTASFAFVPTLIKREQLVEGNSKFAVSQTTSQTLGPGLAGILVQWLTAPVAIALDAVSFLLSALLLLLIRTPEPVLINSNKTNFWQELSEGVQVVLKNPLLRAIACCASTIRMFTSVVETVYILYVTAYLADWLEFSKDLRSEQQRNPSPARIRFRQMWQENTPKQLQENYTSILF